MGTESGVLQKKTRFLFFLFFLPFLAVFGRGLVFFHVFWCFFVFSWWYQVQTHLVVPRKHCFLNIFGIPCFSDVFWQRVFFVFFPHA